MSAAPASLRRPVLQATMLLQAESFVCRRCRTDPATSHEAFDSPYHFHPEIEIILMENSHGTRHVADSIEPYGPGDLVMIGANVPHVFIRDRHRRDSGEPESSVVVQFHPCFMGEEFLARPEMREVRELIIAASHGLHFDVAMAAWAAPRLEQLLASQGARRVGVLLELLDRLAHVRGRPLARGAIEKKIPMKDFARLDRVLSHIAKNYSQDVTLAGAARVAALRPASFSRWFRGATSKSFIEYLTEFRLGHAYRQLTESGKTVTEIAFDSGFSSLSHFIHRFREVRGMSPSEFRRSANPLVDPGDRKQHDHPPRQQRARPL